MIKDKQYRTVTAIIFLAMIVLVATVFWGIDKNSAGIPLPVLPPVDTAANPLSGICSTPASVGYIASPAGFPFSYEVYNTAQCKVGTNFFAVAMNTIVAVGLAGAITAGVTRLSVRKWHG